MTTILDSLVGLRKNEEENFDESEVDGCEEALAIFHQGTNKPTVGSPLGDAVE